jgi:hypothetical protein
MLKFRSFLSEGMTALRPGELSKPNSKTKEPRIDILKHAVINGITLALAKDNSEVKFANTPENITAIDNFDGKTPFNLITTDNKEISSSQIGKSAIFGGGAGAGGGTENTAQTESGQCLWLAAMLQYGNQPIEFFTPSILKSAMKRIDVGGTSFDEMVSMDSAWQVSAYLSAQKIIKAGYANKKHKFHRDSDTMNYIYKKAKKEAFKNSDISALTDDKWNPGDIWAIEDGVDLKKELDTSSIGALNTSLLRLFKERKVVGISLKLVKKDAKAKEYNIEGSPQNHKFVSGAVKTQRGTFFSNKGGTVEFSGGTMEIRPNNYLGANKIEIMGKTARGGGAGWGVIMAAGKRYLNVNIPAHGSIKRIAQKLASGKNKRSELYFYKMAKSADASLTFDYYMEEIRNKDAGWFSAKLAAVMIVHYLNNNKGRKADSFVNAIVNYAASSSDDSSAFVKIYQ